MNTNLITSESLEILRSNKTFYMSTKRPLLGFNSSYKISKGLKKYNYTTGILYLQPSDAVGKKSGRLAMLTSQRAMTRRTLQYVLDPDGFKDRLRTEIVKNETDKYCIRLNGTSDIDFSDLISSLPNIQFYDYTKVFHRVERNTLTNYHLTYSASFKTPKLINKTKEAAVKGFNIALPLNTKGAKGDFQIPTEVIINNNLVKLSDFDTTDLRFLDKAGSIGTLTRKGSNIKQRLSEMSDPSFFANLNTLTLLA